MSISGNDRGGPKMLLRLKVIKSDGKIISLVLLSSSCLSPCYTWYKISFLSYLRKFLLWRKILILKKIYFDAGIASSTATAKESLLQGLRVWLQTEVRRDLSSQLQVGIDKLLRFVMDIFKIILMKHYFLLHLKWTIMKQVIIITL